MAFVHMQLGSNDPVRVPDDPDVVSVFEARGFEQVDDPTTAGVADESAQVAEVDDHGIGWLHVVHDETGGTARIPNQPGVLDEFRDKGWRLTGEPSEAEALEEESKEDLQKKLRKRGQPVSGTKQELIDRLAKYEAEQKETPVEPTDTEEQ